MNAHYSLHVSQSYEFRRGDPVAIFSGCHKGVMGMIESAVFQRSVEHPNDLVAGYHAVLDYGRAVGSGWNSNADGANITIDPGSLGPVGNLSSKGLVETFGVLSRPFTARSYESIGARGDGP